MKLCPKCEFIYEDDQRFCDMDREALVEDTRVGVFPGKVQAKAGAGTTKSRARIFVVPAIAGLALSLILSLVYYASSAPLDSKFESRGQKSDASETSLQQQTPPPLDNPSSQPVGNPSQSPANPETPSESGAVELADRAASESARSQVVPKSKASDNSLKGGENSLGISNQVPPLPQLTPLPEVPALRRLPAAKPEARTPGSTTPGKQRLNNQKSAGTNRKASAGDVKPDRGDARSRVGSFFKKTGRLLKKPFQL